MESGRWQPRRRTHRLAGWRARVKWLLSDPDLEYPEDSHAVLQLELATIEDEQQCRERRELHYPAPDYAIPRELVQELKQRVNLVALISDDVALTQRGRSHVGLCPSHHDRSPSLVVWPDGWTCFGCHVGGDAIGWIMASQRVRFRETVIHLCALAGMPLPECEARRRVSRLRRRSAMPAEREAVTIYVGEGWSIIAAGARREQDGSLTADLLLSNGKPVYADRGTLNDEDTRTRWAASATSDGRPSADKLKRALLEILPEVLATLQERSRQSQADQLVGMVLDALKDPIAGLVEDGLQHWHTPDGNAWATIPANGHREHWPLSAKGFRRWLAQRFYEEKEKIPNAQPLVDAINVLAGKALFEGAEYPVRTRLAEHAGCIYLDLANERWEAVEIDTDGWRVGESPASPVSSLTRDAAPAVPSVRRLAHRSAPVPPSDRDGLDASSSLTRVRGPSTGPLPAPGAAR